MPALHPIGADAPGRPWLPDGLRRTTPGARSSLRGHRHPGHQTPAQRNRPPERRGDARMNPASASPIAAPFLLFICKACGLIYNEAVGDADSGLAAGTRFADIPDDWACPLCNVTKTDFELYTPPSADAQCAKLTSCGPAASTRARHRAGVVIVGAGRAGWQMAEHLRAGDADLPITLVTNCTGDVYDK